MNKDLLKKFQANSNPYLVHFITNYVTMNDVANAAIITGVSPIMAEANEEINEIGQKAHMLVVNTGTMNDKRFMTMLKAMTYANVNNKPILLDPVGVGASSYRLKEVLNILNRVKVDIIKCNGSEAKALLGINNGALGVDSESLDQEEAVNIALQLNKRLQCTIALTGKSDIIVNHGAIDKITGGSIFQTFVTGTGCMANSIIAACILKLDNVFEGTILGLKVIKRASELAEQQLNEMEGPMMYKVRLLDNIYHLLRGHFKGEVL